MKQKLTATILLVVVLFGVFLAGGWMCPFLWVTGLSCPGCGMTRALLLLLQGDAAGSFAMNPMLIPILLGCLAVCSIYFVRRGKSRFCRHSSQNPSKINRADRLIRYIIYILLVGMIVVWVYRLVWCWGVEPMEYHEPNLLKSIYDLVI